jgi:DNA-binding beta-propeller fold protein YncE
MLAAIALSAASSSTVSAQNWAPNPYRAVEGVWGELPDGRTWGSVSAVYVDADDNVWTAERCGGNAGACEQNPGMHPVVLFSPDGEVIRSFGAGMIVWPHGIHVDPNGNVWIADARGSEDGTSGHQVHKFTPHGELLMSLGTAGVAGDDEAHFNQPSDMLVSPDDGSVFVVDGHGAGGNNRVVKFDRDGRYLMEWGGTGRENGEFRDPHALAMDSRGRLFVGDRANSRIQIFTQDGEHVMTWTQFGRPSGLYIDGNDILYSADSESTNSGGMSNMGFARGIRIGSVRDGLVTAFIPDPEWRVGVTGTTAAEGVTADSNGNVYGAEVGPRMLRKWVRVR